MSVLTADIEADIEADLEAGWYDPFDHITGADRAYMNRPLPQPCVWCGGRHRHNPLCAALCDEWQVRMPFGKHKGQRVADVPKDYLRFLITKKVHLEPDVKREVYRVLNIPLFEESQP